MKYSKFRIRLMFFFMLTVLVPTLSLWFTVRYLANSETFGMDVSGSKAEVAIQEAINFGKIMQAIASDEGVQNYLEQAGKTAHSDALSQQDSLNANISELQSLLRSYTIKSDVRKVIWSIMAVFTLMLVILGIASSVLLSRGISNPIMRLVEGTTEVAKGNFQHCVSVKAKDEIKLLVDSFNSMVSEIWESREKLKRTERIAAWRDVARKLAHEIKNPLTPIQLSMYRLRRNLNSSKYAEIFDECYNMIAQEVESLRNMVEEFSQFARMPKPKLESCDVNALIDEVLNAYQGIPENIIVQRELENIPPISIDPKQFRQVLHNLIQNAVDAMNCCSAPPMKPDDDLRLTALRSEQEKGGTLNLTTQLKDDSVIITIQDTGHGMSEEVKNNMFNPYFTTKENGTGLGMSIVQKIIEEHGGAMSVESKEGIGTSVYLSVVKSNE